MNPCLLATFAIFFAFGESADAAQSSAVHHYFFTDGDNGRIATPEFLQTSAFEGAQNIYSWRDLEPEKDAYDFSDIKKDLEFLAAHGKKLFVQLEDVSFSPQWTNVPTYLLHDPEYHGGADRQYDDDSSTTVVAWVARRWDPAVQDRFHKLLTALGKEFDGQIEGINLEETSINDAVDSARQAANPQDFYAAYRDGILVNMKALKTAFPKSVALQYANFMPGEWLPERDHGYLRGVYEYARAIKVGVGGPDLKPYFPAQMNHSYGLIRESAGIVPIGIAVQEGDYEWNNPQTHQRAAIADTIHFATDYLKADYIFWCPQEPYYSKELIPFLRAREKGKTSRND